MDGGKRKAEDGEEAGAEAAKRPKVEQPNGSSGGAAAPAAGPPKKLGIDLEKLQKAKLALQKQKELKEKLQKAGITVRQRPEEVAAGGGRWWRHGDQWGAWD